MKKIVLSILTLIVVMHVNAQLPVSKKDFTKPEATEVWKPVPAIVSPAPGDAPPSDAIVLFNGSNTDNWIMARDSQSCKWDLRDGILTAKPGTGDIKTKLAFADCQLHIEFMLPADVQKAKVRNDAGNSGVYLQERYEVQIFDSYQNGTPLYANGQCGSIYKQAIPLVNANNKPGEWNTFDIYYTAPSFRYNGSVEKPAYITVVQNNILILNHFEIQGTIRYIGTPVYEPHDKASVLLQEHGSAVSFRNIWIREL